MTSLGEIGEVKNILIKEVEWRIPSFFSRFVAFGRYYESGLFLFAGESWSLRIYSTGVTQFQPGYFRLHLVKQDSPGQCPVLWRVSLRMADGTLESGEETRHVFESGEDMSDCFFPSRWILLWNRQNEMVPSSALTIVCTLKSWEPDTEQPLLFSSTSMSDDTVGEISVFGPYEIISVGMSSLQNTGETEIKIEWKIPDFLSLSTEGGMYCESDSFSFACEVWHLRIYPGGIGAFHRGNIRIQLVKEGSPDQCRVLWRVGLKKADGVPETGVEVGHVFGRGEDKSSCAFPCTWWDLWQHRTDLVPSDVLTIVCSVKNWKPDMPVCEITSGDNSLVPRSSTLDSTVGEIRTFEVYRPHVIVTRGMPPVHKTVEMETRVEWRIPDFFFMSTVFGKCYKSGSFSFAGESWHLLVYPGGVEDPQPADNVCVHLVKESSPNQCPVRWNAGLRKADGTLESGEEVRHMFGRGEDKSDCSFTCTWMVLWNRRLRLAPSDILTIVCSVKSTRVSMQLSGLETLSRDLHDLFNRKKSCDTTLIVEGKTFEAHRWLLVARSPVFAAMFEHDMSERESGTVIIPDCDQETFGQFLSFLYCGKVEDMSFRVAIHLYRTAHKYMVPELSSFCVLNMVSNLAAKDFVEALNLAEQYEEAELLSALQDFFNENFHQISSTKEWEDLMRLNFGLANRLLQAITSK